jgi:glycosyltransferase involved in cell wall biosynthesis
MAKVSLTVIHRQEWHHLTRLANCLKGVFSEIVFCNTDPNPTIDPAWSGIDVKAIYSPWRYDFSSARNFVASAASERAICWLDSDDLIEPAEWADFIENLEQRIGMDPMKAMVYLPYVLLDQDGQEVMRYHRERIFPKDKGQWVGAVHECWIPKRHHKLKAVYLNEPVVYHWPIKRIEGHSTRNLEILEREASANRLDARGRYYLAQELFDHGEYMRAGIIALAAEKKFRPENWYKRQCWILAGDCFLKANKHLAGGCFEEAWFIARDAMSWHSLLSYHFQMGNWADLEFLFTEGKDLLDSTPQGFALNGCSTWRPWDMLSISVSKSEPIRYDAAVICAKVALKYNMPNSHRQRIEANLDYFEKQIIDTENKS